MESLDLPQYIINLERAARDTPFGEVGPFYLMRHKGETVGMRGQTSEIIRFKTTAEAVIYLVDYIKTLPTDKSGDIVFAVKFTNGRVKQITTTSDITTIIEDKADDDR